jgi:hypothetical protein
MPDTLQEPTNKRAKHSGISPPEVDTSRWLNYFVYSIYSKQSNAQFSSRGAKPKRYTIDITMSIPNGDEECPLTLEPIAESKLPFLPDTPFILNRPKHTKLTLPCKHSFSAMTLLYSFCKNSMVCPCCRAGEDIQADTACLPSHFRLILKAKIQETLETERRQDESRDYQDVLDSFSLFGVTIPYQVLGSNGNLSMVANFYDMPQWVAGTDSASTVRPIFSFSNLMEPNRENGRMVLVPRGPLRALTHVAHMGVNSIQLSIILSMQGTGDVLIDSTPITRMPDVNNPNASTRLTIPGASNSAMTQNGRFQVLVQLQRNEYTTCFSVLFSRTGAFSVLNNITWTPGTENLEILSSNVNLASIL